METIDLASEIKKVLSEKFPGRYNYIQRISEITGVHPRTVRKKISGESQFTVDELYKVATALDISFGNIFNRQKEEIKHPMEIYFHDYSIPREYNEVKDITLDAFKMASAAANSKYFVATNTFPDLVHARYEWIAKYFYLRWLYFNKGRKALVPIIDMVWRDGDVETNENYLKCIFSFKSSIYILHIDSMRFVCDEIKFYYDLGLLSLKETQLLLGDYSTVLNECEKICIEGLNPPYNQKKVDIYYSNILLEHALTIIESDELNFAIVHAAFGNSIVSKDYKTFLEMREWFNKWIRSANIISMSNVKHRIWFFNRQRAYIDEMKNYLEQAAEER